MSKDQIEEMAKVIHDVAEAHHIIWCTELAKILYNAGYRKQSEGENIACYPSSAFQCSKCDFEDWDTTTADSSRYNFCPHCGAKMKGGEQT